MLTLFLQPAHLSLLLYDRFLESPILLLPHLSLLCVAVSQNFLILSAVLLIRFETLEAFSPMQG